MNSITSTSSNALRITGMATGLDTDTLIKQMMAAENMKVDKLKQNQQYTVWRQEAFRDIIKDFRDLRNSYLLIDSPSDTNMIKSGAYSGAKITSSNENVITATALPGAVNGISNITVKQVAKSALLQSENLNKSSAELPTDVYYDYSGWNGKTITFKVKDKEYIVQLSSISSDGSNLNKMINDSINNVAELRGKVSAEVKDGKVSFTSLTDNNIRVSSDISELSNIKVINPTAATLLSDLGIEDGTTFSITQGTMESSTITLKSSYTIQEAMNEIYKAKSNKDDTSSSPRTLYSDLQVSFSELTGSLTIQTRNTGSSQSIKISKDASGNNILGFTSQEPSVENGSVGKDAVVEITPPGSSTPISVIKSSNNFTIDNVTYNLIKESPVDPNDSTKQVPATLTTQANSEDSVKNIKAFIDKYNALVKKINDKLTEKKDYNYKPLTADQKKEMEEDDIKSWEEKAKKGILKNDGDLQQILFSMRNAFMSGMDSAGIKLSEVGIDTYGSLEAVSKPGQLKVDDTKLKKALEERGDQVMKLFTASEPSDSMLPSTMPSKYTDASKWQDQYKYDNTGIFRRIESIINNSAGKFDSTLLKKAGYEGTVSEFTNTITKQIQDQDKAISELNRKLYDKQERYYQMFARLESAMNQMNSQQSWLAQQLGQ